VALPEYVNKCQEFDVTFRYYNYTGWNNNWADPTTGNITACINWTGNAELVSVQVRKISGGTPQEAFHDATLTGPGNQCVHIPAICGCCAEDVKWHFKCTDIGQVKINSTITVQQTNPVFNGSDTSETVCLTQEYKAHLTTDVLFFVQDAHGIMTEQDAVVPGNDFHVVIPVINTGNADAWNAKVYITITDQPEGNCSGSVASYDFISYSGDGTYQLISNTVDPVHGRTVVLIANLGTIPGINQVGTCQDNVRKAILLLHCRCEGHVSVFINGQVNYGDWSGLKGLRAIDANTNEGVPQANIVIPPCPMVIEQIPFRVEIENPITCQTFARGDTFAVKALITNGSTEDLNNISAKLWWRPGDPVELLPGNSTSPSGNQSNPKAFGNLTAGNSGEITWELRCTGLGSTAGEVLLWVTAATATPNLMVTSDTVNVHQTEPPGACLTVTILSPGPETYIATGQQFAVTAKVENSGPDAAVNVIADINYCGYSLHYVTLATGETEEKNLGTIGDEDFKVVTWTLVGGSNHDFAMGNCSMVNDTICVSARMDTAIAESCSSNHQGSVEVTVYPAAFLVATIDSITPAGSTTPVTSISTCSEFTVSYTVTNLGVADAWNTSVTLSVSPDDSVRPASGSGGYTQPLGTIPGWDWGTTDANVVPSYISGTFTLHCKLACESTLTLTPAGYDECGWDVFGLHEYMQMVSPMPGPGREIPSKFIVPASETVKQLDSGQLDLAITKTVDNAFPTNGQTVNFTITVTNNGPTAASGVAVTDTLPANYTFVSATPSQGSWAAPVWTVGSLVNGGSASLVIAATATTTSQRTNTAAITAVDQPDPFASNDSASVTLNKPAVTSMQFTLKPGWNLFSLPLVPGNSSTVNVVGGITQVAYVYGYDAETGTWSWWTPPNLGTLTNMTDGWGYWIYLTGSINKNITITGTELPPVIAGSQPPVPPSYDVFVGWNLLGFKSTTAKAENVYLAGIHGLYIRIYGYADGAYFDVVDGANLQPGMGYWIAVPGAVPGIKVGSIFP
jgi:uncharacterized repeat protein (TIGR01451 family)